jgi:hypothetical protein
MAGSASFGSDGGADQGLQLGAILRVTAQVAERTQRGQAGQVQLPVAPLHERPIVEQLRQGGIDGDDQVDGEDVVPIQLDEAIDLQAPARRG